MIKFINYLVLIALSISLVACSAQRIDFSNLVPNEDGFSKSSDTFFIGGIGQRKSISYGEITAMCGGQQNLLAVEHIDSPINILLSIVTFGIYTPRDLRVYCKDTKGT